MIEDLARLLYGGYWSSKEESLFGRHPEWHHEVWVCKSYWTNFKNMPRNIEVLRAIELPDGVKMNASIQETANPNNWGRIFSVEFRFKTVEDMVHFTLLTGLPKNPEDYPDEEE